MKERSENDFPADNKGSLAHSSKVALKLKTFKELTSLSDMKSAIPIDFPYLTQIFETKFVASSVDEKLIFQQFSNSSIQDIVRYFMIYAIYYDKETGFKSNEELFGVLRSQIRIIYRKIISNLVGKVKEFLKVLLMISYFTFYSLIQFNFYELNANRLSFCVFCFEIVHFEINGFNINPEALRKTIMIRFGKAYKVPIRKISMVNIKVPSSEFDTIFRKSTMITPSEAYFNFGTNELQVDQFKRKIESKTQYIKNSCMNTINRFKDDMEKFKQSRNKSFEIQHLNFRKMKKQNHFKINKSSDKLLKEKLNINSISHGLLDNTFNPKRCHYVSKLRRHHPGRVRYQERADQAEVP